MTKPFKVGDRVKILRGCRYDLDVPDNPRCVGTVTEINPQQVDFEVRVVWDTGKHNSYPYDDLVWEGTPTQYQPVVSAYQIEGSPKPDGGPQGYYDLPPNAGTLNDLIEYKSEAQWLGHSPHLMNIFKAVWRWGGKDGTSKEYDARKIIYFGCRLLRMLSGNDSVRKELQKLLDEPQFKESK